MTHLRRPLSVATFALAAIVSVCVAPILRAQQSGTPGLIQALHRYLEAYEPQLSLLVADEVFEQRSMFVEQYATPQVSERRRLESDVGFLRLPGGLAWLGQRNVLRLNGRAVATGVERLDRTFASAGAGLFERAKAIADSNARFNLGHPRSLNLPTLPLDLLGRHLATHFVATVEGSARVNGHRVTRMILREHPPGGIIAHDAGRFVRVDVRAWIADDGALHRAHVTLHAPDKRGRHEVRVDFAPNAELAVLVPVRLSETFDGTPGGDGVATYRNFRQFATSAKLRLPPG